MKKINKFPSAETLVKEAYDVLPKADLNSLHSATFKIMMKHRSKTGGYCYIPPEILKEILSKHNAKRFKSNDEFVSDMNRFVKSGVI